MQASIGSIRRPLLCTFYALLLSIVALCAMPRELYVLDSNNTISTYNTTTEAVLNPGFITGLSGSDRFALSGNVLFVANSGGTPGIGTVSEYTTTTGGYSKRQLDHDHGDAAGSLN